MKMLIRYLLRKINYPPRRIYYLVVMERPQTIPDGLSRIGREPGHVYWKGTEVMV